MTEEWWKLACCRTATAPMTANISFPVAVTDIERLAAKHGQNSKC